MPAIDQIADVLSKAQEQLTNGLKEINTDHALIHDGYGLAFTIYNATLTTEQVKEYSFKAPASRFCHIKNLVLQALGGSVKVEILGNVTVTVDTGTAVPIRLLNDNSQFTPGTTIKESPTFSGGTVRVDAYALADSTNQTTGVGQVAQSENQEFITQSDDEYYVIRITNLTTDTIGPVVLNGFFYEETQGISS